MKENRKEKRTQAEGQVSIKVEAWPLEFNGRLLDVSPSGFRAAHNHSEIATGEEVSFRHAHAAGRARVVWNRILQGHVETGFLVISSSSRPPATSAPR